MKNRIVLVAPIALVSIVAFAHNGCFTPEVYDTPADLSASDTSGIAAGYTAVVRYQGGWTYDPDSAAAPDGETVVTARGGGAWLRLLAIGYPGALDVDAWFVDSEVGDDANDCLVAGPAEAPGGKGACADIAEVFRRYAGQQPSAPNWPTIDVRGDFSQKSYIFSQAMGLSPTMMGERLYAAPDGGAYPSGVVTSYQAWDGGAHQEGLATVTMEGGAPLDVSTYTTANGYWLEVTGGPRAGLGVPVGDARDAGVFATSSGSFPGTASTAEPAAGDVVQVYRLTPIATAPGTSLQWGGGGMVVQNVEVGSAQHSVSIATLSGPNNGVELNACVAHGVDVYGAAWLFDYGAVHTGGLRVYGRLVTAGSTFDGLQARDDGELELSDHTLVTTNGIHVGGRDGPGYAQVDGPTCVSSYTSPAFLVEDGQLVYLSSSWWARNGAPGVPTAHVDPGSTVLYDLGMTPACVGKCAAAPWDVGGAMCSTLPVSNNGAAILQND